MTNPNHSPRVVRIVEPADSRGLWVGIKSAVLLWLVFVIVFCVGLNVPLLFWGRP